MVFQMVSDNLWKVCEPEPASQEEQALEARQKEALQLEKEREKVWSACSHKHSCCQTSCTESTLSDAAQANRALSMPFFGLSHAEACDTMCFVAVHLP